MVSSARSFSSISSFAEVASDNASSSSIIRASRLRAIVSRLSSFVRRARVVASWVKPAVDCSVTVA